MKTNIPINALPSRLSQPNKLSTTYTTNVLFPKLGPAAVSGYVKLTAKLLRDLASSVALVEKVKAYSKQYNTKVSIVRQPEAWLRDGLVFQPVLTSNDIYSKVFLAGLTPFNDAEIKDSHSLRTTGKKSAAEKTNLRRTGPSIVAVGAPISDIPAITDMRIKELALVNGRVTSLQFTPVDMMAAKDSLLTESGRSSDTVQVNTAELGKVMENQKKAYMLGNIMHGFSQPNAVIADMVNASLVNVEGDLIAKSILTASNISLQLIKDLQSGSEISNDRVEQIGNLIDSGIALLEKAGINGSSLLLAYRKNPELNTLIKKYCIRKFDKFDWFGDHGLPSPVQVVSQSREWAFQRVERLDILMGEPELRGPFNAESVSPNSELTISESSVNEQFDFSEHTVGRAEQQSNERAVFTSSRFQSALSNMTESGISDENSFTTDSTLLNTLREQRRAAIDKTLTNISTENESRTLSGSRNVTSSSRTYTTRGKDPKLATTELSFQVASKVDIEVRLEDINLVWAPYIYSPFLYTHQIIRNYKETSIYEYQEQNIIIDPVRPLEEYETGTFKKELGLRGRDYSQSKNFDFPIPGQFLGQGWELDKGATTIAFRNGTSDDYNWDETWNWDDLENWDVYYKTLRQDSGRIKGEATLETTDPEYFNKGFIVFNFQMRRLSERSKAELRAYAAEQGSAEAERRAVLSRSRQYGELRKEELISRYAQSLDLKEEAFNALIDRVFSGALEEDLSYYKEIIRSCINWNNVTMQFDYNRSNNIPFAEYSRSHFMNSPGIRFILPIIRSAEDIFFDTINKTGNSYYESAIVEVRDYTNGYRDRLEELKDSNSEELILDNYSREIILGRHLEAVLSNHPFAE